MPWDAVCSELHRRVLMRTVLRDLRSTVAETPGRITSRVTMVDFEVPIPKRASATFTWLSRLLRC